MGDSERGGKRESGGGRWECKYDGHVRWWSMCGSGGSRVRARVRSSHGARSRRNVEREKEGQRQKEGQREIERDRAVE
jgi:hypothetical protein